MSLKINSSYFSFKVSLFFFFPWHSTAAQFCIQLTVNTASFLLTPLLSLELPIWFQLSQAGASRMVLWFACPFPPTYTHPMLLGLSVLELTGICIPTYPDYCGYKGPLLNADSQSAKSKFIPEIYYLIFKQNDMKSDLEISKTCLVFDLSKKIHIVTAFTTE